MDLNKLTTADRVVGVSAIVFLIATFLPWYGIETEFGTFSHTGWDYFLSGILPLLVAVAMVAVIVINRFSTTALPALPIPWKQVLLIAGAAIAVILVLRTLIVSDKDTGGLVDLDRMYGLFLALLSAIGLAVGGWLMSQEPEDAAVGGSGAPGAPGGYPQQF